MISNICKKVNFARCSFLKKGKKRLRGQLLGYGACAEFILASNFLSTLFY